jgi:hypothetical protein
MGLCIVNIFQYISNKKQLYTVYLFLESAVHVPGRTSTHHQERIQLYVQHLVFVTPLLLSAAIVEELELHYTVWQIPDAVDTVVCAPDDGWRYHPKHVEQFSDINKLCNVASCWIYIGAKLSVCFNVHLFSLTLSASCCCKIASSSTPNLCSYVIAPMLRDLQFTCFPSVAEICFHPTWFMLV